MVLSFFCGFHFFQQSNAEVGYSVMFVKANDGDSGENGHVTYHFKVENKNVQETDEFYINEETGEIVTKVLLDREVKDKYEVMKHIYTYP